jgi:hypothetical protein
MPKIQKTSKGFVVTHKDTGKRLGGPYPTRAQAVKRRAEVPYPTGPTAGAPPPKKRKKAKKTTVAIAKSKRAHGPVFAAMTRTAGNTSNPMAYPS